jgi:hypothetical protein
MRAIRQTSGRTTEKEEPTFKGELTKITPEKALEKKDNKLKKVEEHTFKLIEKHKERKLKSENPTQAITKETPNTTPTLPNLKRDISRTTYQCMPERKTPKQILNHVMKNIFKEENQYFSKIDTYQLIEELNPKKTAHYISKTIHRLRDEGWFEIIKSNSSGYRLLKIDIKNYQ